MSEELMIKMPGVYADAAMTLEKEIKNLLKENKKLKDEKLWALDNVVNLLLCAELNQESLEQDTLEAIDMAREVVMEIGPQKLKKYVTSNQGDNHATHK